MPARDNGGPKGADPSPRRGRDSSALRTQTVNADGSTDGRIAAVPVDVTDGPSNPVDRAAASAGDTKVEIDF